LNNLDLAIKFNNRKTQFDFSNLVQIIFSARIFKIDVLSSLYNIKHYLQKLKQGK